MKLIYLFIGIVMVIILLGLIIINTENTSTILLLGGSTLNLYTWAIILISSLIGGASGVFILLYILESFKEKVSKHARNAEKASIKAEESSDKAKALEAKVETLERALKKALKDK